MSLEQEAAAFAPVTVRDLKVLGFWVVAECPACNGSGADGPKRSCATCEGKGSVARLISVSELRDLVKP